MASPRLRAFRTKVLVAALRVSAAVGRRVPLSVARFAGRSIGRLAWYVSRRDRRRSLENIAIAFPEWTERQRRTAIRAMFRHLGMCVFELLWLPNLNAETLRQTTIMEGMDKVQELVGQGRSLVAITGHCGNWEWLARVVTLHVPLTVIQRERNEPELNQFIKEARAYSGVHSIDRGSRSSAREMIAALKKPGLLAFLIDQTIRAESARVPFFGRPALTVIGPVRLAIRTGSALLPLFIERLPNGKQLARFLPAVETRPDDDPIAVTALMTRCIEDQVRRAPEQWVWIHERWKYRPEWDVELRDRSPQ